MVGGGGKGVALLLLCLLHMRPSACQERTEKVTDDVIRRRAVCLLIRIRQRQQRQRRRLRQNVAMPQTATQQPFTALTQS